MRRFVLALVSGSLALAPAGPSLAKDGGGPVVVTVMTGGKPAADVPVRLVVKTWPGGEFRMARHAAKSDAKGKAKVEDAIPAGTKSEVYAAVVAKGSTLVSRYVTSGAVAGAPSVELRIERAAPLSLRCMDDHQAPVVGVEVSPLSRCDAAGVRHFMFGDPEAADFATSGADGRVDVPYFLPGEWVGVRVRFPGKGLETRNFTVPTARDAVITIPATASPLPDRELSAGGDPMKRMFLVGPKVGDIEPSKGYGVLLVLPGGDGSDKFREFVRDMYDTWVDAGFVAAELVAPTWSAEQAKNLVWPTGASKVDGVKFTTEELVASAIDEAAKHVHVDRARVIAVSWSSSGPACWRMLSLKSSPITAHLIAMSVFHPRDLDSLKNGKSRPLCLLHSPEDKKCPLSLAEEGRDAAKRAGIDVGWATYEGGHGWAGDSRELARAALFRLNANLK